MGASVISVDDFISFLLESLLFAVKEIEETFFVDVTEKNEIVSLTARYCLAAAAGGGY